MYYFKYLCKKLLEKLFNMNVKCKSPKSVQHQQQSCVKEKSSFVRYMCAFSLLPLTSFGLNINISLWEFENIFSLIFFLCRLCQRRSWWPQSPAAPLRCTRSPSPAGTRCMTRRRRGTGSCHSTEPGRLFFKNMSKRFLAPIGAQEVCLSLTQHIF